MDYSEFEKRLLDAAKKPLPGQKAQYKMTPQRPFTQLNELDKGKVRHSAVVALFRNIENKPHIILTQRNVYKGVHSGQISFPGGRWEKGDKNFKATALRETKEEIGLNPHQIRIVHELTPLYIPPSNFLVNVFTGLIKGEPELIADPREVARIIYLDFNLLMDESVILTKEMDISTGKFLIPVFQIEELTIWGATAMMISEIKELLRK